MPIVGSEVRVQCAGVAQAAVFLVGAQGEVLKIQLLITKSGCDPLGPGQQCLKGWLGNEPAANWRQFIMVMLHPP